MRGTHEYDIKYVKGIGPSKAKLLAEELKVRTVDDLLHHFPSHYVDRSRVYALRDLAGDMAAVQVKGRFVTIVTQGEGAKMRLVGLFSDGTGTMEVVWFRRIKALKEAYQTGKEYMLFGKPQMFNGRWSMVHPEVDPEGSSAAVAGLRGVYPLTEKLRNCGVTSRTIFTWVQNALASVGTLPETLPEDVTARYRLMDRDRAMRCVHNPSDPRELAKARERLKFEELFYIQLNMQRFARQRKAQSRGFPFPCIGRYFNEFYSHMLPFPLTEAQKRVLKEIRADLGSGRQMNRLLQGDVGSGKTIVALMTMLMALDNGRQAAIMAPTEILATQHYETMRSLAAPLGVNVRFLTGSTRKKERDVILAGVADGSVHITVGTHALIEDSVKFANLGLVIIDEQHRFGVMQRARLWEKNSLPPHVLVMTATPIPRTLAMTVYGDLDVSVIDQLPPGRKPVTTLLRYDDRRMEVLRSVGRQLAEGRQAYIVYPLIEESEKLELKSLEEGYDFVREVFPSYRIAYVHGRMKPAEKDYQMQLFAEGTAQVMVATTVIEVGVNVPNASVMVIENAERFGLSQLHQLRGRVGRGASQSYCVLMTKRQIAAQTRQRLELMTTTTDGFVIAEADLRMRGPGDIEGTMQSGIPFDLKIASLATDGQCVQMARNCVDDLLEADPTLTQPAHTMLVPTLMRLFPQRVELSRIS
ncbi:MAG: ATP-dependent DNA helicase RecG [Muribaculaceae bacterium]|nr:ATP-dependent DNA helicase RecG [Muribaculaceae bacterium]